MEQVPWLTEREERVWRRFAAVLVGVLDEVEGQLQRDAELTHFGYWVLSALSEAPGRAMRMSELAVVAYGSRSRLSHLVASMERRGFIRRERAANDGRGSIARLTDAGYAKVVATAPGHVVAVRSGIFDALSPRGLDDLEHACTELLARIGAKYALPPSLGPLSEDAQPPLPCDSVPPVHNNAPTEERVGSLALAIGVRVRQERQELRWTLGQLAEAAGVSRRMVVNVEQGATNPSVGTLLKLSDALGVGLPALVEPPDHTRR
jgi:DNA-binding MarR family transcriptional regulator/DNA-binding XRE family transcriptional regulator